MKNFRSTFIRIFSALLLVGILMSQFPAKNSNAQSPGLEWDDPVNVSQTGSTALPVMVPDSSDRIHVFWDDTLADQGYSQWDGQAWTPSSSAEFSFAQATPQMLNDKVGNLFALWIDPVGSLLFSRAVAESAGNPGAWSTTQTIADEVISFSTAIGNNGNLYVAYIIALSTDGTPAGIYTRVYRPTTGAWGAESVIYQSQYFRGVTLLTAHVNVSVSQATDQDTVFIAWDDAPLKRVYLVKSIDEGETWGEAIEIDGPKPGEIPPGPSKILTYANKNNLLVLWQTNMQSAFDCTQKYQFSSDLGDTWQSPEVMFEDLVGCPQSMNLFSGPDDLVMLMTMIQDTSYLVAWDGSNWSEPRTQPVLNSFSDPVSDTLVKLGDLKPVITSDNQLFVAGGDTTGNGDIWVLSRPLGSKLDWFPPKTSWTIPTFIASTSSSIDEIQVVSDGNNVFHVVWREYSTPVTPQAKDKIFYAQYDGGEWSIPVEILNVPDKNIGDIWLAYDQDGFLYLTWSGKTNGQIYFAWANANRANSKFEWSEPILLPAQGIVTSPSISEGLGGELLITYVIPVNENRGVYLIKSTDNGITWSEPIWVFNAAEAGWDMVGQPIMLQNVDGTLTAIWTKRSILVTGEANGLYSSSSVDGGLTWGPAQTVDQIQISSIWLERTGAGILHRVWEGDKFINPGVWHEVSTDGGYTWQRSIPVSILGEMGVAAVTPDVTGHLHIFQSFRSDLGQPAIVHLWWDGVTWEVGETLQYPKFNQEPVNELAAAVDQQGKVLLVMSHEILDPATQTFLHELVASERLFEGEPIELVPTFGSNPPLTTQAPTISAATIPVETAASTPAITNTAPSIDTSAPSTANSNLVIVIAVVTAVLFILGGLFVMLRK